MSVVFRQGQTLGRGDLDVFMTNTSGQPMNVYTVTYALYYVDPGSQVEVLIGSANRDPVNPAVGEYYAAIQIPSAAIPGDYRIRWSFRQLSVSPMTQVVQEFGVVSETAQTTSVLGGCQAELVHRLRVMLRDNDPARNYKFRPPTGEGTIGCYNQVFGFIWTDEELLDFLKMALDKWNAHPPATEEMCSIEILCQRKPSWKAALLWGAVVHAALALSFNWVSEEFSVKGDTLVRVVLPDGGEVDLPISDLYDICYGGVESGETIRAAFQAGQLRITAVEPTTGVVGLHVVSDVMRHETSHKPMVRIVLVDGRSVETTIDHSLFHRVGEGLQPAEAGQILVGDTIATVGQDEVVWVEVASVEQLPPEAHTYDLSVPGPQNFTLASGVLAHNSYSIGGISLDLDKSSKYQSLSDTAESQWDKLTEAKRNTVKYLRGLSQPKFGTGVRSAFGPNLGRGVLSPRSFQLFLYVSFGWGVWEALTNSALHLSTLFV